MELCVVSTFLSVVLYSIGASGFHLELDWSKSYSLIEEDYDLTDYPSSSAPEPLTHWSRSGTVTSTGRNYTIHVGSLHSNIPSSFSFQLPKEGCCHVSKTSTTASQLGCDYATNAGFFSTQSQTKGCCVGSLIVNSSVVQLNNYNRVVLGLNNSSYVIGYLSNQTIQKEKFFTLITGAGWLVRKGESYISAVKEREALKDSFVTEKAPRTAAVIHQNGSLSLMQVDGEEDIKAGLDLQEFSEVLVQLGAWQAVNLDGGGSSVSVFKGQVVSRPTCIDISFICERQVSSIACMKIPKNRKT